MTTRYNAADRLCLTYGKTSDRKAYVGPKCGPCVIKFGIPRKSVNRFKPVVMPETKIKPWSMDDSRVFPRKAEL